MRKLSLAGAVLITATVAAALTVALSSADRLEAAQPDRAIRLPPRNIDIDYQLGGSYLPPEGVGVVSRDWWEGQPLRNGYSICYVNAFQTQENIPGIERPDERGNWPPRVVLWEVGDDPNWPGEVPIDIRTPKKRRAAANHLRQMVQTCADKGFDAVEFDNLDTWTRFGGIDGVAPIRRRHTIDYAQRIVAHAHSLGLAVAQKNATLLTRHQSRQVIGFDFVVGESCGAFTECDRYTERFGDRVLAIEYDRASFEHTCEQLGDRVAVVLRDRNLSPAGTPGYLFDTC